MSKMTFFGEHTPSPQATLKLMFPFPQWWLSLPERPMHLTFTLKQRFFGPMRSHSGQYLGFIGRCFYGWLFTDDPYFDRVDAELKFKGI